MLVAIGSDHGGYDLKEAMCQLLEQLGHTVLDCGCNSMESVDYPVFAEAVCKTVINGKADCGILICGTGIGMSIAANRHREIRAALCHESFTARMSREHNNANVLCMGARVLGIEVASEIVRTWMETSYTGGRHQRRLDMFS
jgi:ribose 5-phosphate isomerase B